MQVLFHKHVWLYLEYMPTLHWWTGASSVSPYVITITWGIASDIIIHHWSNSYELFIYCASLIYFTVVTVTITTILLSLLLLLLPLLSYYFATKYFVADTKLSRCGWIDNSTANTWEYSLAPLCRINKFGWILYPRKLLRSPILVGYQDYFLAPLPGNIALFFGSLGIYICWSLWRTWKTLRQQFIPQLRGEVRNCHLALHLIHLLFWVSLRHLNLLLLLILICRMLLMMPLLLCMVLNMKLLLCFILPCH